MGKEKKRNLSTNFTQLFHHEQDSLAWYELSGNAVKLYMAIKRVYNGDNNGTLAFGSRRAGKILGKDASTGQRAMKQLVAYGFLKLVKQSTFNKPMPTIYYANNDTISQRKNYASEYALTCYPHNSEDAKHDYLWLSVDDILDIQKEHKYKTSDRLKGLCDEKRYQDDKALFNKKYYPKKVEQLSMYEQWIRRQKKNS